MHYSLSAIGPWEDEGVWTQPASRCSSNENVVQKWQSDTAVIVNKTLNKQLNLLGHGK